MVETDQVEVEVEEEVEVEVEVGENVSRCGFSAAVYSGTVPPNVVPAESA